MTEVTEESWGHSPSMWLRKREDGLQSSPKNGALMMVIGFLSIFVHAEGACSHPSRLRPNWGLAFPRHLLRLSVHAQVWELHLVHRDGVVLGLAVSSGDGARGAGRGSERSERGKVVLKGHFHARSHPKTSCLTQGGDVPCCRGRPEELRPITVNPDAAQA